MIQYANFFIINILYIYINLLKSLDGFWVKKGGKLSAKEINKLIKRLKVLIL
jgi:hypothetical protein